jgi:small basic protein
MEKVTQNILSYLFVYQNTVQKTFEFRLLSGPSDDPIISILSAAPAPDHRLAALEMARFIPRLNAWFEDGAKSYQLKATPIDSFVLLTDVRFSDNYYYVGMGRWAIVALGGWQNEFAPPSIVEYYLSFTVIAALDAVVHDVDRHYETRGCVFDFNASLDDARWSVLSGQLCNSCTTHVENSTSKLVLDDARILLNRTWLGTPSNPSEVALTVKKLGYDLFHTAGIKPTFKERCVAILEQEGLKNLLSLTFQILLAIALVVVGLKKN